MCYYTHFITEERELSRVLQAQGLSIQTKRDKEPFSISFPTIYRAIDTGILPPHLKKIMRFKWKHKSAKPRTNAAKFPTQRQ